MSFPARLEKPGSNEHHAYYGRYVALVPAGDVVQILGDQINDTLALFRQRASQAKLPYAPGKWTLHELLAHLIDAERLFAFRALHFARGDTAPLPSMDQDLWQANTEADARSFDGLLEEWALLRRANVLMFDALLPAAWLRSGEASGSLVTVRALAHTIAGHELHHVRILLALPV